jgi:hypothetical protein
VNVNIPNPSSKFFLEEESVGIKTETKKRSVKKLRKETRKKDQREKRKEKLRRKHHHKK